MVRAVIFDMDGVLIDTEKHLVRCWREAAAEFGFSMQREQALQIRSLAGKFAEPLLKQQLGEDFQYEAVRMRRKELMEEALLTNGLEKKPGVDYLLDICKSKKIRTAVATATDEERAGRYLKEIGIYDKMDAVICATMVENGKPMPDIYEYAAAVLGERKEECLALEDSPNGIRAAFGAGIPVVMVPDLTWPDEEIRRMVIGVCRDLYEAADYL